MVHKKGKRKLIAIKSHIRSFADYVKFIDDNCTYKYTLFRGQRVAKQLLPRIARINLTLPLLQAEREMMAEFQRRALPSLEFQPKSRWDWLAVMQHHGCPTRLLDWTMNPLAALWFAVRKPPLKRDGKEYSGVVWIFQPTEKDFAKPTKDNNPFSGERTLVFRPNHITQRIVAQSGWFTVHKYLASKSTFVPLDQIGGYAFFLDKIVIPAELFSDLRIELDRFGINSATMFPDLDGLSQHISWLNSCLEDEPQDEVAQEAQTNLVDLFSEE